MAKSRFTTADVKAMVRDVRSSLLGQRVANIYDLNDKTYLFKFAIPGVTEKAILLMESGTRFHTTKYARDKSDMPSPFAMKLRKYIRTKRLEDIRQIGADRVVDFKFGSGDGVFHIILELYASGNIVLTDSSYQVIALLRSHKFEEGIAVQLNQVYPIAFTSTSTAANNSLIPQNNPSNILEMDVNSFIEWSRSRMQDTSLVVGNGDSSVAPPPTSANTKKEKAKKLTMRQLLVSKESGIAYFGPEIIEHCLLLADVKGSTKVEDMLSSSLAPDELINKFTLLRTSLIEGEKLTQFLDIPGKPGYILFKESKTEKEDAILNQYWDFVPQLCLQHQDREHKEFSSFDEAVDEYFCKVEEQKMQSQAVAAEEAAMKKVNKVKTEMRNQLQGFVDMQNKMELYGMIVEAHAEDVDKVLLVIRSALGSGMSWDDVSGMVTNEQAAGNPVARLISKLKLDKGKLVLRLSNVFYENDSDNDDSYEEESVEGEGILSANDPTDDTAASSLIKDGKSFLQQAFVDVEVTINLSAYANAGAMYDQKKVAKVKEQKTGIASEHAIASIEKSTMKQLEKQKLKRNLQSIRKVHWFERFNWFISSEGYLILSGRDAQQNELLVKRYLRKGDVYVHADIHGASSCVVRAKSRRDENNIEVILPISPFALQEAGGMTVCRSGAWTAKVVTSAWWVHSGQVSKTAPSGEYLTTGSFMIYGRKNFLPPMNLEMGFGIMFRLDDASVMRHMGEKKDRNVEFEDDSYSVAMSERYDIDLTPATVNAEEMHLNGRDRFQSNDAAVYQTKKDARNQRKKLGDQLKQPGSGIVSPTLADSSKNQNEDENDIEVSSSANDSDVEDEKESEAKKKTNQKFASGHNSKGNVGNGNKASNALAGKANSNVKNDMEMESKIKRKVPTNKKKARRYANQDDEDLALAMEALGHIKPKSVKAEKEKEKSDDLQKRQQKAGVNLLQQNWDESLNLLSAEVRGLIQNLVDNGQLKEGELDSYELKSLSCFDTSSGLEILALFTEGGLKKIGNKSGFLAGIMRRYAQHAKPKLTLENGSVMTEKTKDDLDKEGVDHDVTNCISEEIADSNQVGIEPNVVVDASEVVTEESRRERKKKEQLEIKAILEEEGILDEMEGKQADDLEKLTGIPLADDVLLYAVPMCGPYSAFQNFKYRVKLTPGPGKKGKVAKQIVDVFVNSKECSLTEKDLLRGLTDPEMVAILIGDVKLNVAGLQNVIKSKKNDKKKKSEKE